jgi:hypothetical protein
MRKAVLEWWDGGLHMLDTLPTWLAAFLIGWAFSVSLTQPIKFLMPRRWCADDRELYARLLAFFSAMIPAGLYYADSGEGSYTALWLVMVGTGLWSPIAFALLIAFLRRGGRESFIADVLTGDKRGVVAAKLRGDR